MGRKRRASQGVWGSWLATALMIAAPAALAQSPDDAFPLPDTPGLDWLSDTVTRPHANVATSIDRPAFTVEPLDAVRLDAVGLLPEALTGLPRSFWGVSEPDTLARLFAAQPTQGLPAALSLTQTLALAEIDPPLGAAEDGALFLARVDLLLARGALDPAMALMERAGATDPRVFRRFFDVSLLTDQADRACAAMGANPDIAPTFPARIFCLARNGDWSAAALSLGTGEAIGRITRAEADLIARFLDPMLFEEAPRLPPDPALTPLSFAMRMAIAERPDLTGQPLAFAIADLTEFAGWRAQLDAAERLVRSGAITPAEWFSIATARMPSASGAVWDRVAAIQALDAALLAGDQDEIARRLLPAVDRMEEAGLLVAFAEVFATRLARHPLSGAPGVAARRVGLLSSDYEATALATDTPTAAEAAPMAIARGGPVTLPDGATARQIALAAAFTRPFPAHRYTWFLRNDRTGEAVLRAARVLASNDSDPNDLRDALLLLREVGLESIARRAALQLWLLETDT